MKTILIFAAVAAILFVPVYSAAKDVILIANSLVETSELSRKDVIKIFLGKKIAWDDNTKIVVALQKNHEIHNAFLEKYMHESASAFATLWKRRIFTGKKRTPKYFQSDKELIEYVGETRGAIGYVSDGIDLKNVKAIRVK